MQRKQVRLHLQYARSTHLCISDIHLIIERGYDRLSNKKHRLVSLRQTLTAFKIAPFKSYAILRCIKTLDSNATNIIYRGLGIR